MNRAFFVFCLIAISLMGCSQDKDSKKEDPKLDGKPSGNVNELYGVWQTEGKAMDNTHTYKLTLRFTDSTLQVTKSCYFSEDRSIGVQSYAALGVQTAQKTVALNQSIMNSATIDGQKCTVAFELGTIFDLRDQKIYVSYQGLEKVTGLQKISD